MIEKVQEMTFQQDPKQEQTEVSLGGEDEWWCGEERLPSSTVPWEEERGTGRRGSGLDITTNWSVLGVSWLG